MSNCAVIGLDETMDAKSGNAVAVVPDDTGVV